MFKNNIEKHMKNTGICILIVIGLYFIKSIMNIKELRSLLNLFIGVFVVALVINLIRFVLIPLVKIIWKSQKLSYDRALNRNIHFYCQDEPTQFLIKIGSLFSITEATVNKHNKNEKSKKGFINCIETSDYNDAIEKERILLSLEASWDIENKYQLLKTVDSLLDTENFMEEELNGQDFEWLKKRLDKHELKFETIQSKKTSNHTAAFNIQRAILLLREGLTCDLISLKEFEEYIGPLYKYIKNNFNTTEEFIVDYLIGVCYFYKDKVVFGPSMIDERIEGIKILIDKNYFNQDLNLLVEEKGE